MEVIKIQDVIILAEDKKKKNKRDEEWCKENTTRVMVKLNHNTDRDILDAIADAPAKSTELKRLVRIALYGKDAQ